MVYIAFVKIQLYIAHAWRVILFLINSQWRVSSSTEGLSLIDENR